MATSNRPRIKWDAFNLISTSFSMKNSLMVGEVNTLSSEEIEAVNAKLDSVRQASSEIDAIFEQARVRFR